MNSQSKIFLATTLVLITLSSCSVFAQTSTDSAQQIRDAVQKKVAEELAQIKKAVAKRSFVGTVATKSEASLTLTNLKGQNRTALLSTDTTIKLSNNRDGQISDIKVGDFVIAMGDVDSQNTMTSKRLLVIAKPTADSRKTVFGSITKISSSTITLQTDTNQTTTVKASSTTRYTQTTKLSTLKVGDKLLVVGTASTDGSIAAKRIHVFTP